MSGNKALGCIFGIILLYKQYLFVYQKIIKFLKCENISLIYNEMFLKL